MHRNIEVYKAHLNRIHFPFPLPPPHQPGGLGFLRVYRPSRLVFVMPKCHTVRAQSMSNEQ